MPKAYPPGSRNQTWKARAAVRASIFCSMRVTVLRTRSPLVFRRLENRWNGEIANLKWFQSRRRLRRRTSFHSVGMYVILERYLWMKWPQSQICWEIVIIYLISHFSRLHSSKTFHTYILFRSFDNKDGLSDEQVENLLLNEDCTDIIKNETNISK